MIKTRQILTQHFFKFSILPILLIEVLLVILYFSINYYISQKNIESLKNDSLSYGIKALDNEVQKIEILLHDVQSHAHIMQENHQHILSNPKFYNIQNIPNFDVASNGVFYKTDRSGASLYYSSKTKITKKERDKAIVTEAMDTLLKSTVEQNDNMVAAYFNSFDNMNRLYPFIDKVYEQYGSHIEMAKYNFYFLADKKHNPNKKAVWTDTYLDPAGNGWMLSCIFPIYNNNEFLEGVSGIDITIESIVKNILDIDLPFDSKMFLVDKSGMILAMPKNIENLFNLQELKTHKYNTPITDTVTKPNEYNVFNNKSHFASKINNMIKNNTNQLEIDINDKKLLILKQTINITDWNLLFVIDENNLFRSINELKELSDRIGYLVIMFAMLFYMVFFLYLKRSSQKVSDTITKPLEQLADETSKVKKLENIHIIDTNIFEIEKLNNNFIQMGKEIEYHISHLDQEVENKTKELLNKNIILEEAKRIASLAAWELNLITMNSSWSDNIKNMLGITDPDIKVDTKVFQSLLSKEDLIKFENAVKDCIFEDKDFRYTFKLKKPNNNHIMWFDCRGKLIKDKNIILGTIQDITNEKVKQKQIERYVGLIDQNIIISTTDLQGNILHVSEAFCRISGYTKEELMGKNHNIIRSPDMPKELFSDIWNTIKANKTWKGEIKNRKKDGSSYWISTNISPVFDDNDEKIGYTAIKQDITDKKVIEELSITDALTEIYNRRYFNDQFPKIINIAKRKNELISFLIMDIDYFKQYNDTYGHQMGDEVLKQVASILKSEIKRTDDYCFRLGGEEFGVVFKTKTKQQAIELSTLIKNTIEGSKIEHKKSDISEFVTASFGLVCIYAEDIKSYQEIYKKADELLYKAKGSGRNRVCF